MTIFTQITPLTQLDRLESYPHRWFCHQTCSRFHSGTGNYQECWYIFGCIRLEIQDRNTRRCLRSDKSAGVRPRNVSVCVFSGPCVGAYGFFIFQLTVLAALPLPARFAHTPEWTLAIHAEHSTLPVARERRALVTDLWGSKKKKNGWCRKWTGKKGGTCTRGSYRSHTCGGLWEYQNAGCWCRHGVSPDTLQEGEFFIRAEEWEIDDLSSRGTLQTYPHI